METMKIIKSGQIESRLMRSIRNDLTRLVSATAWPVTVQTDLRAPHSYPHLRGVWYSISFDKSHREVYPGSGLQYLLEFMGLILQCSIVCGFENVCANGNVAIWSHKSIGFKNNDCWELNFDQCIAFCRGTVQVSPLRVNAWTMSSICSSFSMVLS